LVRKAVHSKIFTTWVTMRTLQTIYCCGNTQDLLIGGASIGATGRGGEGKEREEGKRGENQEREGKGYCTEIALVIDSIHASRSSLLKGQSIKILSGVRTKNPKGFLWDFPTTAKSSTMLPFGLSAYSVEERAKRKRKGLVSKSLFCFFICIPCQF
jgi:hypothetical protein